MGELNNLRDDIHGWAINKGWWEPGKSFGEQVALFHSEASEALEEFRNGLKPGETYYKTDGDGNEKPEGIPIELADLIIRVLDTCGRYEIDIERAIAEKMAYNQTRKHRHGGKAL